MVAGRMGSLAHDPDSHGPRQATVVMQRQQGAATPLSQSPRSAAGGEQPTAARMKTHSLSGLPAVVSLAGRIQRLFAGLNVVQSWQNA